jgi:FkbM family methyltransferase
MVTSNRRLLGWSYDHLLRNAHGSLTVEVPEIDGSFEIDIRSHILRRILVNGEYEPDVVAFVAQNIDPQRDAIDVGANIGLFTVKMLASGARRVLAVEPTPLALRCLEKNILNCGRGDRAVLYRGAAGAEDGEITIHYVPGKEEYSSVDALDHPAISGLESQSLTVPMKTIDSLVEEHSLDPALIKIDTEGSEQRVLKGTVNVLKKHRPLLIMEKWPGAQAGVDQILADCSYTTRLLNPDMIIATPR